MEVTPERIGITAHLNDQLSLKDGMTRVVLNASESKGDHCAHCFGQWAFFNISFNKSFNKASIKFNK